MSDEKHPLLGTRTRGESATLRGRSMDSLGMDSDADASSARLSSVAGKMERLPRSLSGLDPYDAEKLWIKYLSGPGITLSFRDLSIVEKRFWNASTAKLIVQCANGLFEPGRLHTIVDVELNALAGKALIDVLCGSRPVARGTVTGNNVPVASARFRRAVGVIGTEPETIIFHNLTVAENILFSLEMRCRVPPAPASPLEFGDDRSVARQQREGASTLTSRCWKPIMEFGSAVHANRMLAAASFFGLNPDTKARDLTTVQQFLLVLAMELVLDPPIVYIAIPIFFQSLDPHAVTEVFRAMKLMGTALGKTLVCLMRSLPFPAFDVTSSVVLLGLEGQTLFSGDKSDMLTYFSMLGLPSATLSSPVYDTFRPSDRQAASIISSNVTTNSGALLSSASVAAALASRRELSQQRRRAVSAPVEWHPSAASETEPQHQQQPHSHHDPRNPAVIYRAAHSDSLGVVADDTAEDDVLVFDTGDAAVDLVTLWAESLDTTVRFAAHFFDSNVRKNMTARQEELALGSTWTGTLLTLPGPNHLTFLKFQPQSSWKQMLYLSHVFFLQSVRNADFYIAWLILTLLLAFTSWLVSNQNEDQLGMMNIRGLIFLLLFLTLQVNVTFVGAYTSEIELYRYQRDSGYYSAEVYIVVFFTRLIMTRLIYLVTAVPFVLYAVNISRTLINMIGLLSISHAAVVYCKALLLPTSRIAQVLALLYVGYCVVFSGFLINLASLPGFFGSLSLLRCGYAAAVAEELRGRPYSCDAGNSSLWTNHSASYCYTGNQYLELEGFLDDTVTHSSNVFVLVTVVTAVIIGVRLWCM